MPMQPESVQRKSMIYGAMGSVWQSAFGKHGGHMSIHGKLVGSGFLSKPLLILFIAGFLALGLWLASAVDASAATYYVAQTGSEANPCTSQSPCLTIAKGISKMAGGDTLIIRPGTYPERIRNTLPSGTSWSNPTIVRGEPKGQAILMPGPSDTPLRDVISLVKAVHHIIIDGLVLDAKNICCNKTSYSGGVLSIGGVNDGVPAAHIRIQNSILRNARETASCIGVGDGSKNISLLNSEVYGCDPGNRKGYQRLGTHGIYWNASNTLIEGNYFHDIDGNGMQILNRPHGPASNIVVRNNRVVRTRDYGIYIGSGASNSLVANNIVVSSHTGITTGGGNTRVFNNITRQL
jgi:parallel beta-helix repeat protein